MKLVLSLLFLSSLVMASETFKVKCVPPRMLAGGNGASVMGDLKLEPGPGGHMKASGILTVTQGRNAVQVKVEGSYDKFAQFHQASLVVKGHPEVHTMLLDFKDSETRMSSNLEKNDGRLIYTYCGK